MRPSEALMAPALLDRLAAKIEAEMGLAFYGAKRRDLDNAFKRIAQVRGVDLKVCADWLLGGVWDKSKEDTCAPHLTIGETYFFREPRAFDLMCDYARRRMRSAEGRSPKLRIWSAGCCTGEEAYSIAMVVRHKVPGLRVEDVSILATDLNTHNLEVARKGVYRQWSFRNNYLPEQQNYFSAVGENQHRLHSDIKKMVRFEELNLANSSYPSVVTDTEAMDIIFCRNVLMYFSKAQAREVIARFRQCLVNGGWLIVSPSEASSELFQGFLRVMHEDVIFFQKNDQSYGMPAAGDVRASFSAQAEDGNELQTVLVSSAFKPERASAASRAALAAVDAERTHWASGSLGMTDPSRQTATQTDDAIKFRSAHAGTATPIATKNLDAGGTATIENGGITAETYHAKAMIAIEAGSPREAIQDLKRAIYLQPDFIVAHYLVGVLQAEQNNLHQARPPLQAAGELLASLQDEDIVPDSGGLPAAYLRDSIRAYLAKAKR